MLFVSLCVTSSGKAAGLFGNNFTDQPKAFPMFVRLWGSTTEEDAAEGLPEENPEGGVRLSLGTEEGPTQG